MAFPPPSPLTCWSSVVNYGMRTSEAEDGSERADAHLPISSASRLLQLLIMLLDLLLFCANAVVAAETMFLPNCSTIGTTLPTADAAVNMSCTSVAFLNVVVQGSMTLNISISGIASANPTVEQITVTISNMTVRTGATLAIDSRGYAAVAAGGGVEPRVSIMVDSLVGSDGCLLFLGSFPPGTTILVTEAQMKSSTSTAPVHPALDPQRLDAPRKMVMLINLSLTSNASMIFAGSSLVATNPTNFIIEAFYITGEAPLAVSNGSSLAIRNCTIATGSGNAFYMATTATFATCSHLVLSSCTMTAAGNDAIFMNSPLSFSG